MKNWSHAKHFILQVMKALKKLKSDRREEKLQHRGGNEDS